MKRLQHLSLLLTMVAALSLLLYSPRTVAQVHQTGDVSVNLGLGLGTMVYGAASLNASLEFAINDELSIGGAVGYSGYTRGYYSGDPFRVNVFYLGPRATYHFGPSLGITNEKIDLYGGAFIGFAIRTYTYRGERVGWDRYGYGYRYPSRLGYNFFGGMRYQFNPRVSVYSELGAGIAVLQLGVNLEL